MLRRRHVLASVYFATVIMVILGLWLPCITVWASEGVNVSGDLYSATVPIGRDVLRFFIVLAILAECAILLMNQIREMQKRRRKNRRRRTGGPGARVRYRG